MILTKDKERLKREEGRTIGAVKEIENLLGMKEIVRMEAYDISNISGYASVGSMVVYEKGRPKRSDYRKFRIKSVQGPDDYASMEEVLTRRFEHGRREREEGSMENSFTAFPDLILSSGRSDAWYIIQYRMHLSLSSKLPVILNCKAMCFILNPCDQLKPFRITVDRNLHIIIIQSSRSVIIVLYHTAYRNMDP